MRLHLSKIHAAADSRPPGYVEDVLAHGTPDGDWLEISGESLALLREKYRPAAPALPAIRIMARNVASAAVAEVKARFTGVPAVPDEEIARRVNICQLCQFFIANQGRCSKCGCIMNFKARLRSQHCPEGKW